jgi:hypothetical protein
MSDARKLSSTDASFLYLETPEMPMHVGSMAIFRLPEDYKGDFFEDFKAMIASRLHVAPILKARLEKAPLDIDHPPGSRTISSISTATSSGATFRLPTTAPRWSASSAGCMPSFSIAPARFGSSMSSRA